MRTALCVILGWMAAVSVVALGAHISVVLLTGFVVTFTALEATSNT